MSARYIPPTYPVLNFIARSGITVAVILGITLGAGGLIAGYLMQSWFIAAVFMVAATLVAGLLISYVELVRIILDTLVPR